MRHILALDQGTTSSRAIVFDHAGSIVAVAQKEFPQIFPKPGWVEHNPRDIWSSQAGVAAEALTKAKVSPTDVAADALRHLQGRLGHGAPQDLRRAALDAAGGAVVERSVWRDDAARRANP